MPHHWPGRLAVVVCLLLPWPAGAAPIYWQLNGEITDSPPDNPLEGILPVGTHVNYLVTVDPAAPDLCDNVGSGLYQLPATTVSFGGNSYAASSIYLEADSPDGSCLASPTGATIRLFFDSAPISAGVIDWSAFGEALPTVPPSFADISFSFSGREESVTGYITSGTVVPEPSSFVLLVSGLAAIAARRRRRWR
jgi:hypothetical protein